MRSLALCVLAALLAAGCTQTATPSTSSSATDQAGTSPAPGGPGAHGGTLVAPPHDEATANGLRLTAQADRSGIYRGGSIALGYVATNEGADATTHGACERPYAFALHDANGTMHPLEPPMAHCLALSIDPFPSGATYAFNTTWNGTYADGDHLVQAPPGQYYFTATFVAWRDGEGVTVDVTLPLNIISQIGQG